MDESRDTQTYDALAGEYEERTKDFRIKDLIFVGGMAAYLRAVLPTPPISVIDVGCGVGLDCALLESEGVRTVGIDTSREMIRRGKRISPQTEFILGDFLSYEFGRRQFSGVFGKAILHLFNDDDSLIFLKQCHKLLLPKGLLYLSVSCGSDGELKPRAKSDYRANLCRLKRYWTLSPLLELLSAAEFEPIYWNEHWDFSRRKRWLDVWSTALPKTSAYS